MREEKRCVSMGLGFFVTVLKMPDVCYWEVEKSETRKGYWITFYYLYANAVSEGAFY